MHTQPFRRNSPGAQLCRAAVKRSKMCALSVVQADASKQRGKYSETLVSVFGGTIKLGSS
jgi:hypothetical protein